MDEGRPPVDATAGGTTVSAGEETGSLGLGAGRSTPEVGWTTEEGNPPVEPTAGGFSGADDTTAGLELAGGSTTAEVG